MTVTNTEFMMEECMNQFKLYLDLHDENVMQRADGTPVITDPLVV